MMLSLSYELFMTNFNGLLLSPLGLPRRMICLGDSVMPIVSRKDDTNCLSCSWRLLSLSIFSLMP